MNSKETEATPSASNVDNEESEVTSSSLLMQADRAELNASNEENKAVSSTSVQNQLLNENNEKREATSGNEDDDKKGSKPTVSTTSPDQLESNESKADEENQLSSTNRCSICSKKMIDMKLAGLECCEHTFHIECLSEWARINKTCPLDQKTFSKVNIITKSIPETFLRMGMALNYNTAEFRKATEEFKEELKFLAKFEYATRRHSKNSEESSSALS